VVSGDESISSIGILMQRHFTATNVFQTFGHLFSAALVLWKTACIMSTCRRWKGRKEE
jgi:hypothetical protein